MSERVELAEVIKALRNELYVAMTDGAGSLIKFTVGPVDLEFNVTVERVIGAHGGVKFWVIDVGGEGGRTTASTQVVKLRLEPFDAVTRKQLEVADDGRTTARPTGE